MNQESERLERSQLKTLSTGELIRHALSETKLLVKAEILHAKKELAEEARLAKTSAILLGTGAALALLALSALLVALGLALPLSPALGVLLVGVGLLIIAGILGAVGAKKLPRKPMPRTQERLKTDFNLTRETLQ